MCKNYTNYLEKSNNWFNFACKYYTILIPTLKYLSYETLKHL